MSKANQFAKNEEAVSAVIGVILMVAITVILAAVIAAFVIGMGQGVKKTYTVAVTSSRIDSTTITITNMGGNDVDKLQDYLDVGEGTPAVTAEQFPFKVYVGGVDFTTTAIVTPAGQTVDHTHLNEQVGSSVTIPNVPARSHIIVTGIFADGTEQVLLETDV